MRMGYREGEGTGTRKLDGTCCMVRDGRLYKRPWELVCPIVRMGRFELREVEEER